DVCSSDLPARDGRGARRRAGHEGARGSVMLRLSGRVRKILVAVLAGLVVIVAVALANRPAGVRRVAVDQVPKLTGRVLALDDVDLNLFTGHLALKGVRILKRGVNERALELERLDVRIAY